MDKTNALLALLALLVLLALGLVASAVAWGVWEEPAPKTTEGGPGSQATEATSTPETTRERIAKGHSQEQRQVRLRFGCETLGNNVRGVWKYLSLRVQITDEQDQHLAECVRPARPTTVSIPTDVTRMVVSARGYKRRVVEAPSSTSAVQTVILEPDALVRVRATNLPRGPGARFLCSARLATGVDSQGKPILGSRVRYREPIQNTSRTVPTWEFKIPSGVPARFEVTRTGRTDGDRSGFLGLKSPLVTLASGETREITLDLSDFGVLEGRLTGVPQQALEGQVLTLKIIGEKRRFGAGSEAGPIRLDGDGHFRIAGLADQQVSLQLWTQGGESPALQEVGSGRRQWRAGECGFLTLEPEIAVHGVVPAQRGQILDRPFTVQTGGAPDSRSTLTRKIPLFTHRKLQATPLFFLVQGIGHFERSLKGKVPDPDGLYRVEVPAPGGSVAAVLVNQPKKGVYVFVRAVGESGGINGIQSDNSWRFEGLPPADYQLVVCYDTKRAKGRYVHCRRVAKTVAVKSGQETKLTVQMPEVLVISGRVTNWADLQRATAPSWLRLRHAGEPHNTPINKDGSFEFLVLGPWEGAGEVSFYGRQLLADIQATEVVWLPDREELRVRFPGIRKRWLQVQPVAGGRISAYVYPTGAGRGHHLSTRRGRIPIQDLPGGVEGIVCETISRSRRQERHVRGWFRLSPGGPEQTTLVLKGRFVGVSVPKDQEATLALKPPSWWKHPAPAWATLRLSSATPQRLWLPADAAAVVVNGKQEIPAAQIGAKLVLDSR